MKYFFLWAVAISALCSSCESANESFSENNKVSTQEVTTLQQRNENAYNLYKSVVSSFIYNKEASHYNNLLQFQDHVNSMVPNSSITETVNFTQLSFLESADEEFINQLSYSIETKNAITAILNSTFSISSLTLITDTQEYYLITTLYAMYNDGIGNGDDDDKWNDRKIIAFAYGFQYNLTQAVLYAGAIDLRKYTHEQDN